MNKMFTIAMCIIIFLNGFMVGFKIKEMLYERRAKKPYQYYQGKQTSSIPNSIEVKDKLFIVTDDDDTKYVYKSTDGNILNSVLDTALTKMVR